MECDEARWLTLRQVSTLWPGVSSVHETARALGVRYHQDDPARPIRYHAEDVRRLAPTLAATPPPPGHRRTLATLLALLLLLTTLLALALWAYRECRSPEPGFWH
ncbi:hypothetical protein CFP65_0140 [Kitasatospora sp. MMS16-BH015]|nr:hypothetical protein CFP65_0140 [Kitasatospora sp. MMS16-BH015]